MFKLNVINKKYLINQYFKDTDYQKKNIYYKIIRKYKKIYKQHNFIYFNKKIYI